MVGKGVDPKSSRIFHQCYVKCCKLQNLTPVSNVIPSGNGKVLDFCADRIKYVDWPPILNALSCDLSLNTVAIRCRQQVKTVLEHIDCERLAKTVNKRAVILTNFMLSNLVEAITQLLTNTTLLTSLCLEGLPLKIPYLNPLSQAILSNSSLQHLYLPRTLLGDAGCLALCKAVRCLPNVLTLDLSGCELTPLGVSYIAELVKYQKIHRYSENWIHTLRYRLPELDTMAGLRRITLCSNNQLGDVGVGKLLEVLADDLWIKALDVQNCGLTEQSALAVQQMMTSNTTLVILDLRHNPDISSESLSKIRVALRHNERGMGGQYSWLGSVSGCSADGRAVRSVSNKNGINRDRAASNTRTIPNKYPNKTNNVKKEKDYTELLEEQLQDEISHRQQLEELNLQLVEQMKQLKKQQMPLWANAATSSGSEQSFQGSSRSGSSGSINSVPIDQNTLSYIQQAFKDIYSFIKNNQCHGQCQRDTQPKPETIQAEFSEIKEMPEMEDSEANNLRVNMIPKKAQSTHVKMTNNVQVNNKITKSAHLLGEQVVYRDNMEVMPSMFEKHMGDTRSLHESEQMLLGEMIAAQKGKGSPYERSASGSGSLSDSSATSATLAPHPRTALCSDSDLDSD